MRPISKPRILVALLSVLALVVAACGDDDGEPDAEAPPAAPAAETSPAAPAAEAPAADAPAADAPAADEADVDDDDGEPDAEAPPAAPAAEAPAADAPDVDEADVDDDDGEPDAEAPPAAPAAEAPAADAPAADEADVDKEAAELLTLRETFADEAKTREETETLIGELDEAIHAMDLLIEKAEQTSNEGCELLQVFLEIDHLKLSVKREGAGLRLETFAAAVVAGILGEEFVWQVEDETPADDFDFTALDESVLGDNFEQTATPAGQALREEIIRLRQRQRKILDQTRRLGAADERQALLDPDCEPIFH